MRFNLSIYVVLILFFFVVFLDGVVCVFGQINGKILIIDSFDIGLGNFI